MSIGSRNTILLGLVAILIGYLTENLYSAKTVLDVSITPFFQGFLLAYLFLYMMYTFIYKFFIKSY